MAINVIVQYNDRSLPANLLLTQVPFFLWFDGTMHYYSYDVVVLRSVALRGD